MSVSMVKVAPVSAPMVDTFAVELTRDEISQLRIALLSDSMRCLEHMKTSDTPDYWSAEIAAVDALRGKLSAAEFQPVSLGWAA